MTFPAKSTVRAAGCLRVLPRAGTLPAEGVALLTVRMSASVATGLMYCAGMLYNLVSVGSTSRRRVDETIAAFVYEARQRSLVSRVGQILAS